MFKKRKKSCLVIISIFMIATLLTGCSDAEWTGEPQQEEISNLNRFHAVSTKDETFDQTIFGEYDITVICFWAPWSDASVYELQRFDDLVQRFPDRAGFITVGLDNKASKISSTVKRINMSAYTTLVSGDGDFRTVCDQIVNVPTTVFVDNEGNIVGEPVIGIQEDFEKDYLSAINKALKSIGKRKIKLKRSEQE